MNLTNALLAVLLTLLAVLFSLANRTLVEVHFFFFSSAPIPLYVPIFIAFVIGFLGGITALSFSRRKHKREIAMLREEQRLLQQELDNLRNIPLQDDL